MSLSTKDFETYRHIRISLLNPERGPRVSACIRRTGTLVTVGLTYCVPGDQFTRKAGRKKSHGHMLQLLQSYYTDGSNLKVPSRRETHGFHFEVLPEDSKFQVLSMVEGRIGFALNNPKDAEFNVPRWARQLRQNEDRVLSAAHKVFADLGFLKEGYEDLEELGFDEPAKFFL